MKAKFVTSDYSLDELSESFSLEDIQSVLLSFLHNTVISENIIEMEKEERETMIIIFELLWKIIEAHWRNYNKNREKRYMKLVRKLPRQK